MECQQGFGRCLCVFLQRLLQDGPGADREINRVMGRKSMGKLELWDPILVGDHFV